MKIEEVRVDQQVEFFDSRYEGGPHLGIVTAIEGDMVNVKFTYKNIEITNIFNPGQLKLVKQAHTLEEKLISRINDMENRLTQRINNTPSALTIEKRLQDLRGLIVDSNNSCNDHIVNCFKIHDKQTEKSIDSIVDRINYVNTQMVKLSDELDAANKNVEYYKNEFVQSELKFKSLTEEKNHLAIHHADVCKRFHEEIQSNEDLRKLLCESESTLFYQKLWTIGLFMTTAVFAVGFFLK